MGVIHHPDYTKTDRIERVYEAYDKHTGEYVGLFADGAVAFYEEAVQHITSGGKCAICYEALRFPTVHWRCADYDLYMHPGCTSKLIKGLSRDLGEVAETYGEEEGKNPLSYAPLQGEVSSSRPPPLLFCCVCTRFHRLSTG